jgi:hypothetical protein
VNEWSKANPNNTISLIFSTTFYRISVFLCSQVILQQKPSKPFHLKYGNC